VSFITSNILELMRQVPLPFPLYFA
jgi:hypothetical protein